MPKSRKRPDEGRFCVQRRQCATCIYRQETHLDIAKLEAQIADPRMQGFFTGYRECHHAQRGSGVCCRGFWQKHKHHFMVGQMAQRLGFVRYVQVDTLATRPKGDDAACPPQEFPNAPTA